MEYAPQIITALSGILGALVGGIVTSWTQGRAAREVRQQEIRRVAISLAVEMRLIVAAIYRTGLMRESATLRSGLLKEEIDVVDARKAIRAVRKEVASIAAENRKVFESVLPAIGLLGGRALLVASFYTDIEELGNLEDYPESVTADQLATALFYGHSIWSKIIARGLAVCDDLERSSGVEKPSRSLYPTSPANNIDL